MTWYNLFPSLVKVKEKYLYSLRLKKLVLNLSLVQEIDRISCGIVDWTAEAWSTGYVENN